MSNENPSWGQRSDTMWDKQPGWRADPKNPEANTSGVEPSSSSPILGDSVKFSTEPTTPNEASENHKKYVGFATEPGYDLRDYRP